MESAEQLFDKRFREQIHPYGDRPRREERLIAEVAEQSRDTDVLDLGAGDGRLSRPFAITGNRVTAVDFSSEALGRLEMEAELEGVADRIETHQMDLADYAKLDEVLRGKEFDRVLLADTLHLLTDEEARQVLGVVGRVIKDDSDIFIRGPVPSKRFEAVREAGRAVWTKQELIDMAGSLGLVVRHYSETEPTSIDPSVPAESAYIAVLERAHHMRAASTEDLHSTDF